MKILTKRNVIVLILAISLILVCSLAYIFVIRANKTEFDVPIAFTDGFKSKLPIPKGSIYLGRVGLSIDEFKTDKSQEEVSEFYNNYFNGLKSVHSTSSSKDTAYYDVNQRLVIKNIDFIAKENDKATHFTISYEKYYEDDWVIE